MFVTVLPPTPENYHAPQAPPRQPALVDGSERAHHEPAMLVHPSHPDVRHPCRRQARSSQPDVWLAVRRTSGLAPLAAQAPILAPSLNDADGPTLHNYIPGVKTVRKAAAPLH